MKILDRDQVSKFTGFVTSQLYVVLLRNNICQPVTDFLGVDTKKHTPLTSELDVAAEQIDAIVDICYYILNHLTKEQSGISINEDLLFVYTDITELNEWFKKVYQFTTETNSFSHQNRV